jgi:oligoribonuclease NrnB/cAMP/cGMP phosphodiesterase (DHH superfamily)
MTTLCIYHGNCNDGFTAAWVVREALGDDVEFHQGVYGDPPPDASGRDVVIVDFSYKPPVLNTLAASAKTVLVLDHHKTAEDDLREFQIEECGGGKLSWQDLAGVWTDLADIGEPKIAGLFDMNRSGAQITWDFFNPKKPRPLLVDYVADRDLWQFALPFSREINSFVFAHEHEFAAWDYLNRQLRNDIGVRRVAGLGEVIDKKHMKDVRRLVKSLQRRMTIGGHSVPVANIPYVFASDAGHLMALGEKFAGCYWDSAQERNFSLRSTDAGLDVSEIARAYGGGGHRNAARFRTPIGWEGDLSVMLPVRTPGPQNPGGFLVPVNS